MAKLNDLLQEMAGEIPGFIATAVVGMDGLGIAEYSANPDFGVETANLAGAVSSIVRMPDDTQSDRLPATSLARAYTRNWSSGDRPAPCASNLRAQPLPPKQSMPSFKSGSSSELTSGLCASPSREYANSTYSISLSSSPFTDTRNSEPTD